MSRCRGWVVVGGGGVVQEKGGGGWMELTDHKAAIDPLLNRITGRIENSRARRNLPDMLGLELEAGEGCQP